MASGIAISQYYESGSRQVADGQHRGTEEPDGPMISLEGAISTENQIGSKTTRSGSLPSSRAK